MIFERMENDLGGMGYDLGGDGKLSSKGREVIFDGMDNDLGGDGI